MDKDLLISSMIHSKMEQLLIPYQTVKQISRKTDTPEQIIDDRKNKYIQRNLRKWNRFSKEEKKEKSRLWQEEAAVLDFLRTEGITDGIPSNIEIMWQQNEEGHISSCDVRLYYNNKAKGGNNEAIR